MPIIDLLDVSPETPLRLTISRAATGVGGCAGATTTLWRNGVPVRQFSSHPDLRGLLAQEREAEDCPPRAAAADGGAIVIADTLADARWPSFSNAALRQGVRCVVTVGAFSQGDPVTFSLYGLRPAGLALRSAELARALVEEAITAVGRVVTYDGVRREASHLGQALEAREVIEQAKGMLMQALGCSADEAFAELVRTSQRGHLRIADVARHLIEAQSGTP